MSDRCVLFFGDSFTAGAGDPTALGWVGRVAAACQPLTAYNLGVRGETSVQVAARWQGEAWPRLRGDAAHGVVFAVGANDACGDPADDDPPRVDPGHSAATLAELLEGAALMRLPAFVVGPVPVGEPHADGRVLALDDAFARLCGARGLPYAAVAPALSADPLWREEAHAGDGSHPAAAGYARLAELVLAGGFRDWLEAHVTG
ncbi:GDSL-type esterase/lipase family protein [Conexibacter arvalis]|uniref:Lysophospholipase L1-like esterase n=1 Tax=Conexibacter arvalis TaxID=912552 RepID=A0A840IJ62_9ACTN|nr:GDSL-type esterase/lipase family protein [Conexibacter arvalis]MBB4663968.1 lysophospholipase L1-like esterase [Conexibacter arvalis]